MSTRGARQAKGLNPAPETSVAGSRDTGGGGAGRPPKSLWPRLRAGRPPKTPWPRLRAAMRAVGLIALVGVGVVIYSLFFTGREGAETDAAQPVVPPEQNIFARPPARPGAPRPWEAGIDVATYSTANAVNRNLFTAIPLVSWGGAGPDVSLTLYRNSASVDSDCDLTAGLGADLGPGWTISYGGLVIDFAGKDCGAKLGEPTLAVPQIRVVACDGTQDVYIDYDEDGSHSRPAGVHTILDRQGDGYRLRYKDQSYRLFNADGQLTSVVDATGNAVTVVRDPDHGNRISAIRDASYEHVDPVDQRQLAFVYDEVDGRLIHVIAKAAGIAPADVRERVWTFEYDGNGRLERVVDPSDWIDPAEYEIVIGYDADGHITSLSDKRHRNLADPPEFASDCCYVHAGYGCDDPDCAAAVCDPDIDPWCCYPENDEWDNICAGEAAQLCGYLCYGEPFHTYEFTYDGNGIESITDPDDDDQDPSSPRLTQGFTTNAAGVETILLTYTDRRGSEWRYRSRRGPFTFGELLWKENPLGHRTTFAWDEDRNLISYTDALNHAWTYTYDDRGNRETATNPLGHIQAWTYDTLNNLTSYTDAEGNETTYEYALAPCPTLLTGIIEPPDGQGNPAAITSLDYYVTDLGDPITSHGLLRQVTDPNGVVTTFAYDHWGQIDTYGEGLLSPGALPVYACYHTLDANGQVATAVCGGDLGERAASANCMQTIRDLHGCYRSVNCCWRAARDCAIRDVHGCYKSVNSRATPASPPNRAAPSGFPAVPAAPALPSIFAEWSVPENGYTSTGQLKKMDVTLYTADGEQGRDFSMEYDEFGRTISSSIDSDEWGLVRGFTYAYDVPRGRYTRTGPDGVETLMEFDIANRVTVLRRGPEEAPLMSVRYEYYDNGLLSLYLTPVAKYGIC